MIKYLMTAAALKLFSTAPQTKWIYRQLGNTFGQRKRIQHGIKRQYMDRAKKILELCASHHAIQNGDRLLEIGTGWIHWESTIIRLFYDVEITLFDVWDNRNFEAYKHCLQQLEVIIDKEIDMDPKQHGRIHALLQAISKSSSFEEIYDLLDFRYVINPDGILTEFQDATFNVIFSCNVFEHVHRSILPKFIQDFHRLLKPGGYTIHKIDPGDHLSYYDSSTSRKNYLRYSDKIWRRYFENDVQYFNRVQRPEWLDLFHQAGLKWVEEESITEDLGSIEVDRSYQHLSKQDLQCVTLTVVHQKSFE